MAFKFDSFEDIGLHLNFIRDSASSPATPAGLFLRPTVGNGALQRSFVHHFGVDRYIMEGTRESGGPGNARGLYSFDPAFFDESSSGSQWVQHTISAGSEPRHFALGQFNPATGAQRLYGVNINNDNNPWREIDPTLLTDLGTPYTSPDLTAFGSDDQTFPRNGYWNNLSVGETSHVFFEGLTAGGHDNVPAGSYSDGLMLVHVDFGSAFATNDANDSLGWVDIVTTDFVGWLNTPAEASSTVSAFTEPPIDGREFRWMPCYYIADDDATFSAPKGELMLGSCGDAFFDSGDNLVTYIKVLDFNPTGVVGGSPSRTHLRERLISKTLQPRDPIATGFPTPATNAMMQWFAYRAQQRVYLYVQGVGSSDPQNAINEWLANTFLRRPEVTDVTNPNQLRPVLTASTIQFETVAKGDLGEVVAGADATFTLENVSTFEEVITNTFPGGFTLANVPVDSVPDLVVTRFDGATPTILVEGVDYSIVLSTGVGTWITDQSGATSVVATYHHEGVPAASPFGTLLNSTAQTDENGRAFARVRYDDDVNDVSMADRLTVSVEE